MPHLSLENRRIAKNTFALYTRMGVTMVISFFTTRITLQVLGVEDYGLNNLVSSVVSMFGFINASMGTAVQRFFSIEIGKNRIDSLSKIFGSGFYLHVIVAIITFIIAEIFAVFFLSKLNIPSERQFAAHVVFQISAFSLVVNILNVPFLALLRAREEFSKVAILDVVQALMRLGVLFLLYSIDFDKLISLSALNFGISLSYVLGVFLLAKRYEEARIEFVRDKEIINKMLSFISMLLFTVMASVFNKQGIVIVVNLFFGLTINAAYAIAFQVSQVIETFAMSFKQAVVPQLMAAYGEGNRERMNSLVFIGTKVSFLLMMLISIPIIFEADHILKFWLEAPPKYASQFTMWVLISVNINTFSYFVYQSVHATGRIKKLQLLTAATFLLSVLIVYASFNLGGGFLYAVYVPIVFSLIRCWIVVFCAKEAIDLNIHVFMKQIVGRSVLLVVILVAVSMYVHFLLKESLLRFFVIFVLNAIFTLAGGYYLLFNAVERNTLYGLVKSVD